MSDVKDTIWDVIVIGGGAAGMMAAGTAAELGKNVLLLEKNPKLGKKLLITGGGRCNLTNNKTEIDTLVSSYRNKPKALFSLFSQFDVQQTLLFFNSKDMPTKIEAEGRIFPESDKSESVWKVLVDYIDSNKVKVQYNSQVLNITHKNSIYYIHTAVEIVKAKSCIVAAGGTSHPETGSTGDGFKWLAGLGHTIIENNFALVPIALKDSWTKKISGLSLSDIQISVVQNGKRLESRKGKMLFTHVGVSGPAILNLSSRVGDLLQYGEVSLELDLFPDKNVAVLKEEFYKILETDKNKMIKNTLGKLLVSTLVNPIIELAGIDGSKFNHSVTREERLRLLKLIKAIPLKVSHLLGANKAIVSSGGVKIEEVNFRTMESRILPRLFIIGDMLNIDRPSGGYSLQLCWSSGFVAGENC